MHRTLHGRENDLLNTRSFHCESCEVNIPFPHHDLSDKVGIKSAVPRSNCYTMKVQVRA